MERRRGIFTNRTLNLRAIRAIGYDLDYTLVHYHMEAWEQRAYEHLRSRLHAEGLPVDDLAFDPELAAQGLIIDTALGNLVKANRFGYVKRAAHGTRMLPWTEWREVYARTLVDLREARWSFLNTLFSVSEACMYLQLVDRLDEGAMPAGFGYDDLYAAVRGALSHAHAEGVLKQEILAEPEAFVDLDPEMPLALLDQKHAGKRLILITNSEWSYGTQILAFAMDPFLPGEMTWRDVFDVRFFAARKPAFFSAEMPVFRVVDRDEGLLRPHVGPVETGGEYVGGSAALVEDSFDLQGEDVLYVGDHVFADVNVTKNVLRWRTALVLRSLEHEVQALEAFEEGQAELSSKMGTKADLEHQRAVLRLQIQRAEAGYGPSPDHDVETLREALDTLNQRMRDLDETIGPLARQAGHLVHPRWGPLLRTGRDKSHLARQVERYADIYTSRVSNFLHHTPHAYLRSPRGTLPHDP